MPAAPVGAMGEAVAAGEGLGRNATEAQRSGRDDGRLTGCGGRNLLDPPWVSGACYVACVLSSTFAGGVVKPGVFNPAFAEPSKRSSLVGGDVTRTPTDVGRRTS
jgi:hypothetical protein